ncbi:MAG: hypothetical protein KatS3mg104_1344 [Phycisphaerae bacterium]|jgi:predicted acetyltransferase|nr:MAG: hypothetical protein KatS3mg104_1344 [Phycisphaerae bacterium]
MPLNIEWTGRDQLERIARIRWQCYGSRENELESFIQRTRTGRFMDGDVAIATENGVDVGTATSLSLHMYIRGKRLDCQGVAWVGASKSHRRRSGEERGVASQVMDALLQRARERKQVVSALMPFRVSFYEHFGYGLVERQNVWTLPTLILPPGASSNWRFGTPGDKPAMIRCRLKQAESGMCDVETSPAAMDEWLAHLTPDTQLFVDQQSDSIRAYLWLRTVIEEEKTVAVTVQPGFSDIEGLKSILRFLGSLKDQYGLARIVLPVDVPLNLLLKEHQVPHRRVEHLSATCQTITRMQMRILDHVGFWTGQRIARPVHQRVCLAVRECEGTVSRFTLDLSGETVQAEHSSSEPDLTVSDVVWASIAAGELRCSTAVHLGFVSVYRPEAVRALEVLAEGQTPFCYEYF